jgi:hypothetical protein
MHPVVPTCLLLGVIAACHGSDPNAPDGSIDGDGSSSSDHGLSITWATSPNTIPGNTDGGGDGSITTMTFRLGNLRVIGDASAGDDRTSVDNIELDWAANMKPNPVSFADAPTGLYSKVILLADGIITYSYELAGTTKLDGNIMPFQIHDRLPLAISVDTSVMLEPNQTASLGITIRIDQALQSLDFSKLSNQSGTLVLDTFDDAMSDFRNKMMSSVFEADQPQNNVDAH